MLKYRLPADDERILIAGMTGTGKSWEAVNQLSYRSFDEIPWVMLDHKCDDVVARIPVNGRITLDDDPPDAPGLYVVDCPLGDEKGPQPLLNRILHYGNCGVFIDELSQLGQHNKGLRNVLSMGRSKRVPVIMCCQRPVEIDMQARSQASYIQTFELLGDDDRDTISKYVKQGAWDLTQELPPHHSWWYSVRDHAALIVPPAEHLSVSLSRILRRLPRPEPEYETAAHHRDLPRPRRRL